MLFFFNKTMSFVRSWSLRFSLSLLFFLLTWLCRFSPQRGVCLPCLGCSRFLLESRLFQCEIYRVHLEFGCVAIVSGLSTIEE